jgi:hypothetical protein
MILFAMSHLLNNFQNLIAYCYVIHMILETLIPPGEVKSGAF